MAYYLTIEKKKGEYTPIDVTQSKYYTRLSNFKGAGSSLQELDVFTMMFNNEEELRKALFKENLLEMRYFTKPLAIRNLKNGKYHKVMYDFLYQKDMEYIINPEKLVERIDYKLLEADYRFIEKYANTFLKFHDCLSTAPEVREFAISSSRYNAPSRYFSELDENRDNPLKRLTKLLIYEYYQWPSGRIEYKDKVKYRNLHAVLAFVNHYDKKYADDLSEAENDILTIPPVKTKKKHKNKTIPGQMNLFEE